MNLKFLAVGLPFPAPLNLNPDTGAIALANNEREMVMSYQNPSPFEIEALQYGKGRFWLVYEKGVIILQFRFLSEKTGAKFEGEYAFHVGFYDRQGIKCSIDSCEENMHYFFTMSLIDHDTKIVKALRIFTLGPAFLAQFKQLIDRQRVECPDTVNHEARYNELAARYSVNQLRKKAICYCNTGEDSLKAA